MTREWIIEVIEKYRDPIYGTLYDESMDSVAEEIISLQSQEQPNNVDLEEIREIINNVIFDEQGKSNTASFITERILQELSPYLNTIKPEVDKEEIRKALYSNNNKFKEELEKYLKSELSEMLIFEVNTYEDSRMNNDLLSSKIVKLISPYLTTSHNAEVNKKEIKRIIGDAFVNNIKGQEMYGAYGGEIAEVYGYDEFEKEIIEKIAPYITPYQWKDSTVVPERKGDEDSSINYPTFLCCKWNLVYYDYNNKEWYYYINGKCITEPFKYLDI